jgi:hypothetical protein
VQYTQHSLRSTYCGRIINVVTLPTLAAPCDAVTRDVSANENQTNNSTFSVAILRLLLVRDMDKRDEEGE